MRRRSPLLIILLFVVSGVIVAPAGARLIDLEGYWFDTAIGPPELPAGLTLRPADYADYGYFLVQSDAPIREDWRAELVSSGAEIYGYLTEFTFLVGLDARAQEAVGDLPGTRWMGPFHPAYKLCPYIGAHEYVSPERTEDPNLTLLVRVFRDLSDVADEIARLGGQVLERTNDGFSRRLVVRAPEALLPALARIRDVWWIEEKPEFRTMNNTTRWVVQSNINGQTPVWNQGIFGQDQIVTMMDTGLDYNACWFREYGNAPPGGSHRKVIHYTTMGGGQAYDGCDTGHGSHVAGTACGDQSYINPGNYNYNGMAYQARITVQDVGADDWSSCNLGLLNVPSSLSSAFSSSYGLGARAHTNSWGSTSNTYDGYCVDVDNAMWQRPDFLVLFAAGNGGPGGSTVSSPGTAKNCVTAGATNQAPQQETVASYSSRGPASDGRLKPTVMAPGGSSSLYIYSVDNHTGNPPSPTCSAQGNPFMGTSMATPALAGCALNVRTYYQQAFYPHGEMGTGDPLNPSAALLKATLIASTDDMGGSDIPNNNEGWGRVLLDNALFFDGDTRELMVADVTPGLQTGGLWSLDFDIEDGAEPLVVTVVWTDYPGTAGSGIKLVNDLDVTVIAPGGAQYKGNVFAGGFSTTGGSYDRRNVEECVRRSGPLVGQWTVEVRGYNVPHGPQPFAVVINGALGDWPPGQFSAADGEDADLLRVAGAFVTAHPNPTSRMTTLTYGVPAGHAGDVRLQVVDVSGRMVRQLVHKGQRGGRYQVSWDGVDDLGRPVPEGVYFAKLIAGQEIASTKIVLGR